MSVSRMALPDLTAPDQPARAAPLEESRRARVREGRAKMSSPEKDAEAVSVAERHQSR